MVFAVSVQWGEGGGVIVRNYAPSWNYWVNNNYWNYWVNNPRFLLPQQPRVIHPIVPKQQPKVVTRGC